MPEAFLLPQTGSNIVQQGELLLVDNTALLFGRFFGRIEKPKGRF